MNDNRHKDDAYFHNLTREGGMLRQQDSWSIHHPVAQQSNTDNSQTQDIGGEPCPQCGTIMKYSGVNHYRCPECGSTQQIGSESDPED